MLVGIDPGVNTGLAVWDPDKRRFERINTLTILKAMRVVYDLRWQIRTLYVEDARQVKIQVSIAKAQGAASVKRDCQIWQDFAEQHGINVVFLRPNKRITKLPAEKFDSMVGWKGRTSSHGRDAAMIVFGKTH